MTTRIRETLMWIEYCFGILMVGIGLTFLSFALMCNEYSWEMLWLALPIGLGVLLFADAAKKEIKVNEYKNKQAKLLNNYGKNI